MRTINFFLPRTAPVWLVIAERLYLFLTLSYHADNSLQVSTKPI